MSRGWWRDFCYDHPLFKERDKNLQAQSQISGKPKVHCKLCFEQIVQRELEHDARAIQAGSLAIARTEQFIRSAMGPIWTSDRARRENTWIVGRPETILNHLKECVLQTDETRARARATLQENHTRTPSKRRYDDVSDDNPFTSTVLPPLPALSIPSGPAVAAGGPSNALGFPGASMSASYSPQSSALFGGASGLGFSPAQSISSFPSVSGTPTSTNLSPITLSGAFGSHASISSPSPVPGSSGLKRPRSHAAAGLSCSGSRSSLISPAYNAEEWTKAHQDRLEYRLMRITASAGFPLTWTQNPEVHLLLDEFVSPAAVAPNRNSMVNRILPNTLNHLREAQMKSIAPLKHRYGTVQFDSWTGLNGRYYHAFLVSLHGKLHTVEVSDCSLARKTGDNLFALLTEVVAKLEDPQGQWRIIVVSACSDAGPDPSKARRLLRRARVDVVSVDCYGHQTNLLVGGYFKIGGTWYLVFAKVANDFITWLRSKTQLIAVLKVTQEAINPGKKGLSVLRAVLTRWTTHYLTYRRLLVLKLPLQTLLENDSQLPPEQQCVVIGDCQARLKAESMVKVIKDPQFWAALERMKMHLEPLAIASNISQAAHVRLDQVLLLFGFLFLRYLRLTDPDDENVREAMLNGIEARWKKADQDVFIATLILNPYHKLRPFHQENVNCY
ncbi:hypothetical protein K474DRAFT_1700112 [Panus rudis PR-1116 ss-1]|nr:hypothetical protein K474DRAFT_1700112 [Panus rudis PR-1116 ss-1]